MRVRARALREGERRRAGRPRRVDAGRRPGRGDAGRALAGDGDADGVRGRRQRAGCAPSPRIRALAGHAHDAGCRRSRGRPLRRRVRDRLGGASTSSPSTPRAVSGAGTCSSPAAPKAPGHAGSPPPRPACTSPTGRGSTSSISPPAAGWARWGSGEAAAPCRTLLLLSQQFAQRCAHTPAHTPLTRRLCAVSPRAPVERDVQGAHPAQAAPSPCRGAASLESFRTTQVTMPRRRSGLMMQTAPGCVDLDRWVPRRLLRAVGGVQ